MPEQEWCSSSKAKLGSLSRPAAEEPWRLCTATKPLEHFSPCRHCGYTLESTRNNKHDHVLESGRFGMLIVYKLIHQPGTELNL